MPNYIEREAALKALALMHDSVGLSAEQKYTLFRAYNRIEVIPAADVEPVRHGEWLPVSITQFKNDGSSTMAWNDQGYQCSVCGRTETETYDRCRCGARMDLKEEPSNE